jgi:hypothetical protein
VAGREGSKDRGGWKRGRGLYRSGAPSDRTKFQLFLGEFNLVRDTHPHPHIHTYILIHNTHTHTHIVSSKAFQKKSSDKRVE